MFFFSKTGYKMLIVAIKRWYKNTSGDTTWMCYSKETCAKSIVITTWIFAKKVERILYNYKKKIVKNFYESFFLIKFGDLKPSLPLAM